MKNNKNTSFWNFNETEFNFKITRPKTCHKILISLKKNVYFSSNENLSLHLWI